MWYFDINKLRTLYFIILSFINWLFYFCNVLQPSTQSDEHKEHRWSVEKGDGALAGLLSHGYDEDHTGVDVGDRGG